MGTYAVSNLKVLVDHIVPIFDAYEFPRVPPPLLYFFSVCVFYIFFLYFIENKEKIYKKHKVYKNLYKKRI